MAYVCNLSGASNACLYSFFCEHIIICKCKWEIKRDLFADRVFIVPVFVYAHKIKMTINKCFWSCLKSTSINTRDGV
jgi:hypothetical protein